jgi:hypothetical protein
MGGPLRARTLPLAIVVLHLAVGCGERAPGDTDVSSEEPAEADEQDGSTSDSEPEPDPARPNAATATPGAALPIAGDNGVPIASQPVPGVEEDPDACQAGQECICNDGRVGQMLCAEEAGSCDCKGCPEAPAAGVLEFDACGGEPFGFWRLKQTLHEGLEIPVYFDETTLLGTCPGAITQLDQDIEYRLELQDGGVLNMAGASTPMSFNMLGACLEELTGLPGDDSGNCRRECGVYQCDVPSEPYPETTDLGSWTRTETTLDMSFLGEAQYCVDEGELRLRFENGIVQVLERVFPFNAPSACEERAPESCTGGCRLGQCAGDAGCEDAREEANCTNRQGCDWLADACVGTPRDCGLGEYEVIPGCELLDAQPVCSGEREACDDTTLENCNVGDAPGCQVEAGCVGGAVDCGVLTGACSMCDGVDGCSTCAEGSSACLGSSTCAEQLSQYSCERATTLEMGQCDWVEALCRGEAVACAEVPAEICDSVAGCALQ